VAAVTPEVDALLVRAHTATSSIIRLSRARSQVVVFLRRDRRRCAKWHEQ